MINLFGLSIEKSVEYVGFIISPIVKSVAIIVLLHIFQKILSQRNAFLAATLFATNFIILPLGSFGRPDHHIFIILFMIVHLANIARILETNSTKQSDSIKAALSAALNVWISPETLIPLLLIDGILLLSTFLNILRLENLYIKSLFTTLFISAIICLPNHASGYYLMVGAMFLVVPYITFNEFYLTDQIFKHWHWIVLFLMMILSPLFPVVEYDKISFVHMSLYIFMSLFLGINMFQQEKDIKSRAIFALFWGIIIAAVFLCIYPRFLHGMSADISDYVKEIWLHRVSEMTSPLKCGDAVFFTSHSIIVAISTYDMITKLLSKKFSKIDLLWWIFIANALCYTVLAGLFYRMLPYSALFSLPLVVEFGMNSKFVKYLSSTLRIMVTFFLSTFFVLVVACLKNDDHIEEPYPAYDKRELYGELNKLSKKPVVIMAHTNDGTDIMYFTKHSVVGVPYHRQTWGIVASYKIMEGKYDENEAKEILRKTNTSYIFIRKAKQKSTVENMSLAQIIIDESESKPRKKTCPAWIRLISLSKKFNDIVVAKIDRALVQKQ
jgi:hypothetical protein